jgi:hypothetical protein
MLFGTLGLSNVVGPLRNPSDTSPNVSNLGSVSFDISQCDCEARAASVSSFGKKYHKVEC